MQPVRRYSGYETPQERKQSQHWLVILLIVLLVAQCLGSLTLRKQSLNALSGLSTYRLVIESTQEFADDLYERIESVGVVGTLLFAVMLTLLFVFQSVALYMLGILFGGAGTLVIMLRKVVLAHLVMYLLFLPVAGLNLQSVASGTLSQTGVSEDRRAAVEAQQTHASFGGVTVSYLLVTVLALIWLVWQRNIIASELFLGFWKSILTVLIATGAFIFLAVLLNFVLTAYTFLFLYLV